MTDQTIIEQTCGETITTTTKAVRTSVHQQEVGVQAASGEVHLGIRSVNTVYSLDGARIRLSPDQARALAQRLLSAADQVSQGQGPAT